MLSEETEKDQPTGINCCVKVLTCLKKQKTSLQELTVVLKEMLICLKKQRKISLQESTAVFKEVLICLKKQKDQPTRINCCVKGSVNLFEETERSAYKN